MPARLTAQTRSLMAARVATLAAPAAVDCGRHGARWSDADACAVGDRGAQAAPPGVTRLTIATTGTAALTINDTDRDLALSPDGTHVVYIGNNATQLFVRALDALEPVAIASGVGLKEPFVSPDGQWVGFIDRGIHKVAITGGPSDRARQPRRASNGATWARDDTIIFATNNQGTGLQRVSAEGGTSRRADAARPRAGRSRPPLAGNLPGGRAVLFTITSQTGGLDAAQVAVRDLRAGT